MTEQLQAVVDEAKGAAQPAPEADSAREGSDIDALLAQFDQETQKPEISPPEPKPAKQDAEPDWAQALKQRLLQEDILKVTAEVFADLDVPDWIQASWLDKVAREKPALQRAFLNRYNEPSAWNKIVKSLKPEAQKEFAKARKVDQEATADKEAVAAAVRGASTKVAAEPAPDFSKMSDAELQKWKMENFK